MWVSEFVWDAVIKVRCAREGSSTSRQITWMLGFLTSRLSSTGEFDAPDFVCTRLNGRLVPGQ